MLLSSLIGYLYLHKTIEITPFFSKDGYSNSSQTVDPRYLQLMSENLLYSRLNVTPETVLTNHQRILAWVDSQTYPTLLQTLHHEARIIQAKKISASFNLQAIHVDPHQLTVTIEGQLTRHVGFQALPEDALTYQLTYRYHFGHLSLLTFTHHKTHPNTEIHHV